MALERIPRRHRTALADADIAGEHAIGRATGCADNALIAQELHHDSPRIYEGQSIGWAVLQAHAGEESEAEAAAVISEHSTEAKGSRHTTAVAVVGYGLPACQVEPSRACDLEAFADVGAGIVVVDFVDPRQSRDVHGNGHGEFNARGRLIAIQVFCGDCVGVASAGLRRNVGEMTRCQQPSMQSDRRAEGHLGAYQSVARQVRLEIVVPVELHRTAGRERLKPAGRRWNPPAPVPAPALRCKEAVDPFWMIDEGIAIALMACDYIVSRLLAGVHGVGCVPCEQIREPPHVGEGCVGPAGHHERIVVGQDQVGFENTCSAMGAPLVANIHIEERTGHVPSASGPGFPDARGRPTRLAGIHPASAADTSIGHRGALGATHIAPAVELIAPRTVVALVGEKQMVAIGVRIVATSVSGEPIGFGPAVLPVVSAAAATEFGETGVPVDVENLRSVERILIRHLENVPSIRRAGRVREAPMIVDHLVEGGTQGLRSGGRYRVVIPRRRTGY